MGIEWWFRSIRNFDDRCHIYIYQVSSSKFLNPIFSACTNISDSTMPDFLNSLLQQTDIDPSLLDLRLAATINDHPPTNYNQWFGNFTADTGTVATNSIDDSESEAAILSDLESNLQRLHADDTVVDLATTQLQQPQAVLTVIAYCINSRGQIFSIMGQPQAQR